MEFRKNYQPVLDRKKLVFEAKSRTKQSFKDDCDVNNIMKKYNKTGQLPEMIQREPRYGDFSDVTDYQESLNIVLLAQEQFANLPARARDRFRNDPAAFLEFVNDPKNVQEMVEMGLATKAPDPIVPTPPAPPAPPETHASNEPPVREKTKVKA